MASRNCTARGAWPAEFQGPFSWKTLVDCMDLGKLHVAGPNRSDHLSNLRENCANDCSNMRCTRCPALASSPAGLLTGLFTPNKCQFVQRLEEGDCAPGGRIQSAILVTNVATERIGSEELRWLGRTATCRDLLLACLRSLATLRVGDPRMQRKLLRAQSLFIFCLAGPCCSWQDERLLPVLTGRRCSTVWAVGAVNSQARISTPAITSR